MKESPVPVSINLGDIYCVHESRYGEPNKLYTRPILEGGREGDLSLVVGEPLWEFITRRGFPTGDRLLFSVGS